MSDGVFERRNNFLDVRRQLAMTLDARPERDWRRKDQGTVQANRIANGVRSASSATTTSTSMSFGSGFVVTIEPKTAMLFMPGNCRTDVTNRALRAGALRTNGAASGTTPDVGCRLP
jgi:hypothetical protein